jgi:hypothetical protein
MKTAEEMLKSEMGSYYSNSARLDVPTVEKLMKEYARQVAEAVLEEVIDRGSANVNIDQFIK